MGAVGFSNLVTKTKKKPIPKPIIMKKKILLVLTLVFTVVCVYSQDPLGKLYLADADTDVNVVEIQDGLTYNLEQIGLTNISLNAVPNNPNEVNRVVFNFGPTTNPLENTKGESTAPYLIAGDSGGNFFPWTYIETHLDLEMSILVRFRRASDNVFIEQQYTIIFTRETPPADSEDPAITSFTATSQSSSSILLDWEANDNVGITTRSLTYNGLNVSISTDSGSTTVTGLNASQEYTFTLTVGDAAGNITSTTATATTGAANDIDSPVINSFQATAQSSSSILLDWEANDNVGITTRSITYNGLNVPISTDSGSTTVTGLNASQEYTFTLTVGDAAGNTTTTNAVATTDAASGGGTSAWVNGDGNDIYYSSGNVAIGRTNVPDTYRLAVDGKIRTREVRVDQDTWADYVFKEGYQLPTLKEVQRHIEEKGHLPSIPSSAEVTENGIQLGEMNRLLLQKIEELTLYVLKQQEEIDLLKKALDLKK